MYDEDMRQVGMVALCKAANAWDEVKGKFSTFAITCIYHELCYELNKRKKHKNVTSLNQTILADADGTLTLEDVLIGEDDTDMIALADYEVFRTTLNETEIQVLELLEEGLNGLQVAEQLNRNHQWVNQIKRRINYKWRKYNGND